MLNRRSFFAASAAGLAAMGMPVSKVEPHLCRTHVPPKQLKATSPIIHNTGTYEVAAGDVVHVGDFLKWSEAGWVRAGFPTMAIAMAAAKPGGFARVRFHDCNEF